MSPEAKFVEENAATKEESDAVMRAWERQWEEREAKARRTVRSHTTIRLGWRDRVRVMFGKAIHVHTGVVLDVEPKTIENEESFTWVEPLVTRQGIVLQEAGPRA